MSKRRDQAVLLVLTRDEVADIDRRILAWQQSDALQGKEPGRYTRADVIRAALEQTSGAARPAVTEHELDDEQAKPCEPGDTTDIDKALAALPARMEAEEARYRDTAERMIAAIGDVAGRVPDEQPGNLAECERCGAAVPLGSRLCDHCAALD